MWCSPSRPGSLPIGEAWGQNLEPLKSAILPSCSHMISCTGSFHENINVNIKCIMHAETNYNQLIHWYVHLFVHVMVHLLIISVMWYSLDITYTVSWWQSRRGQLMGSFRVIWCLVCCSLRTMYTCIFQYCSAVISCGRLQQTTFSEANFLGAWTLWSYYYGNLGFVTHSGVIVKLPANKGWQKWELSNMFASRLHRLVNSLCIVCQNGDKTRF